jgi:PAS domain S-box-containing protein
MDLHAEIVTLRAALRDLVAMSSIPAVWVGRDPPDIAAGLADVVVGSLQLDFAFVRLCDPRGDAAFDETRGNDWRGFPEWLHHHLSVRKLSHKEIVPNVDGPDSGRGIIIPIGVNAEGGLLAAASARPDFPTETDQLLLSVAANQAATAFQSARLQEQLRQARNGLEKQVAMRTAELRHSEAYLAEGQRLSHTGSFGWNVSSGDIYWSEETFRIFQYDRTTTPSVERVLARVHADDAALVSRTIERAARDGNDFDFEHRLQLPDGSIKHVHVVAHASTGEWGGVEFIGAVTDVTAAREASEQIRLMIDAVPALIWTARADGGLEFASQRWLDYAGVTLATKLEDPAAQYHPDDIERVRRTWKAAVEEGAPFETETRVRRFDGEYRWFLSRAYPLLDHSGNVLGWYGNDIDIHDRKCAEQALKRQANLLEQTHDAILVWELPGPIVYWNRGAEQLYGFSVEEAVGRVGHELLRTEHPMTVELFEVVLQRDGSWTGELIHTTRDGRRILVESRQVALTESDGRKLVLETNRDITGRKEADDAVRKAQAELAHVARVTTLGEMAASIAHEVDQPLSGVVINAKACLRFLAASPPNLDEVRDGLTRITRDGRRASDVIGRIRSLARRTGIEKEAVDINRVIRDVVALAEGEARRIRAQLRTDLSVNLPRVLGDPVQLQQVVLNLIVNGLEAMHAVVDRPRQVIVATERDGADHVRVAVQDSGPGIDPQVTNRIFDAFYTTKPGGMGMGLSISRSIVEQHGGRLWVAPNDGPGTTFQFTVQSAYL